MDFEAAERRLKQDQSKFKSQRLAHRRTGLASDKSKREAARRRRIAEDRRLQKEKAKRRLDKAKAYVTECDRRLGVVRSLRTAGASDAAAAAAVDGSSTTAMGSNGVTATTTMTATTTPSSATETTTGLLLRPTSIHGDGDKIALPPSILAALTERDLIGGGQPLAFRIGILDPAYKFPASSAMKARVENANDDDDGEEEEGESSEEEDDEGQNGAKSSMYTSDYLDELSYRYLSYTHGTVVEFTQDEGHVGLPKPIASALLDSAVQRQRRRENGGGEGEAGEGDRVGGGATTTVIPTTMTVDPASTAAPSSSADESDLPSPMKEDKMGDDGDVAMPDATAAPATVDDDEKTPGHPAYGAFDVPDVRVEVTLVTLPKGKRCTLTPTHDAIRNGFHDLKNVKLVLEQSLIRTRATLSMGDQISSWHRGKKFDLNVSSVSPADFNAVSCINTDIEVDIGAPAPLPGSGGVDDGAAAATKEKEQSTATAEQLQKSGYGGTGRTLSESAPPPPPSSTAAETTNATRQAAPILNLPPEPPADQREGVCTVRIRGPDGSTGRRRFDASASTMKDLFAFAASVCQLPLDVNGAAERGAAASFRLVTRFPRRVFELDGNDGVGSASMAEAGLSGGQENFMVERSQG